MKCLTPSVSVIVPTYNHGHLLGDALQSLLNQTFQDWEAIVVNNYSTDDTEDVVASFFDPRIRLVNFENKGIIAAGRNHGAALASSKILAFLDSDDVWLPKKLEVCLEKMNRGYDLVCHAENWVMYGHSVREVRYGPESRSTYERLLFEGNCLSTSAVLMKSELFFKIGGFCEAQEIVTAEDYDLWLKAAREGASFGYVDHVLGEYRLHDGNNSHAAERHYNAVNCVLDRHFCDWTLSSIKDKLRARKRRGLVAYGCGRTFQGNAQFTVAGSWLIKSILTWPFSLKPWIALGMNIIRYRYGYR